jgi:hypothetical protein
VNSSYTFYDQRRKTRPKRITEFGLRERPHVGKDRQDVRAQAWQGWRLVLQHLDLCMADIMMLS